jgi:hypothetical protein
MTGDDVWLEAFMVTVDNEFLLDNQLHPYGVTVWCFGDCLCLHQALVDDAERGGGSSETLVMNSTLIHLIPCKHLVAGRHHEHSHKVE